MNKVVNYCGNCPFFVTQFDDFAIGEPFTYICNLSQFQRKEDYFLTGENDTPEWCPLKKEEVILNFKEFTPERLKEINDVNTEIKELEDYFETKEYYHTDFKNDEYLAADDRLSELCIKRNDLYSNEEIPFYEAELKDELNKNIDEIKKQLLLLEDASIKLQNTYINLGKENL